ncbi:16S rRNA (guanine(966)-N(2))-methyltransferase RsmD [Pseudomonas sp. BIGb0427]|uniref:16S rRNA (guanine(966)-N(2))-methyltransferase RsmD n=1 Tax=Pseudomonas TaxID=286 RepID=UPI0005EBEF90|nr:MULTISPECIES: 16S rRNA (guanine(966)-N(2))-methyltransferase RsmD [unclassified Pseudomonas]KJK20017.1 16S rRNA methyltransferase [Pseudomonas sp. 2(2015)]QPG64741.1 16S rRNA (guanine(966)-N(2))-methyltransferase RsmD [Pseudomonas sp. BIGb0427]QVM96515.1 16S rRNA (guanine(966)-N(2))-methyltransferase RsmD [Pseudomonas sp. SORT22]UVL56623.1 16S rRNA (guanine(966)-N(2))-methyltransferase RsmD [Pseudomonas sp. B21-035]UVL61916.1 16S rRNA (guanine(966)-N(2))-methyltransferase RsmD [Pseudomonas 
MASPSAKPAKPHHGQGQLRIIAGEWRSRRLGFPDAPGLRPTPDRVRETLFNWLAPHIEGAKVLDAYTGSGALYLEALSRGAGDSVALDSNPAAIASLRQNLETLRCPRGQVIQTDAQRYLQGEPKLAFDLVFLDPPFNQGLLPTTCALLEERQWLAENAWIYTESETPPSTLQLPGNWRLHREKKAGQVYYALWQRG